MRFVIHEFFKGDSGKSIELKINSDMLPMPAEDKSRYAKRLEIMGLYIDLVAPHRERERQIMRSATHGTLDEQVYESARDRVWEFDRQIRKEVGLYDLKSVRKVSSWLGETFHDPGGVIQRFTSYVIVLQGRASVTTGNVGVATPRFIGFD